jgi:hypothetical protein
MIETRSSRRAAASTSTTARCDPEARLRTRYPGRLLALYEVKLDPTG